MLDILEIMKRIPHRYPFLLVDRILEMDKENQTIKGKRNVTWMKNFLMDTSQDIQLCQCINSWRYRHNCLGVLVMEGTPGKVPYFAAIDNAKIQKSC